MNEKLQRLVMHAFRGVPSEMTVDFGKGESTVVYGDNGTGKSTIADALEWYFTGDIELLSHEGRQHAVRYVGGDGDGVTSVEVLTSGTLGGKVVFPDERTPDMFRALRRETFLLRGRTLADFINKTKTEKWKALVEILGLDAIESLREDLQRARNDLRKAAKAAEEEVRVYRRALSAGAETVTEETVLANLQQICGMLGVDPPQSSGSSGRPFVDHGGGWRQPQRRRFVRSREPPGGDQGARNSGVRQEGVRGVELRSWRRTGRACCRVHRWCVKRNGCSRRGRSKRDAARCADRTSTRKCWRKGSRARSSR